LLTNVRLYIFVLIMLTEEKVSRKQQIQEKATELFTEKGYAATSMRDLANHLGIEAASLYSHIRSKEEILQNICFKMAELFFSSMSEVRKGKGTATERMKEALKVHVRVITKDPAASAVFFNEWRHMSEPFLSEFLGMRNEYESIFINILKEGIENGDFKTMDEKFGMLTLLSSLNWVHRWYKAEGKMSAEEVAEKLASMLIDGIKKI
jgi:TetR/AcrR family transcriptional regulator, cholesterol catabolism regulator